MVSKTRATFFTFIFSLLNSIALMIFNLVYYNLLIKNYGSSVNGLISTLTQFVSLFSIIEGGFTTACIVSMYGPLIEKNYNLVNTILYTAKRSFFWLGLLITICALFFGSIYIKFISSPFDYFQTYLLLIISVLTTTLSLVFMTRYTIVLQGDNKEYIISILSLVIRAVTWAISIYLIIKKYSIILIFAVNIFNILLNVFVLYFFGKKKYPQITYKGAYNKALIHGTKDVFFQKIAATIFTSTDLILISVFIDLSSSSVYNLYNQCFKACFLILAALVQAPFNSFGQLLNNREVDNEKVNENFSLYQTITVIFATALLLTAAEFIIPFVRIYTININDYNYVYPILAFLFFSQMFVQIMNRLYGLILNAKGLFKVQNIQCGIAAVLNIFLSVAFIKFWGINSIIFGSVIATLIIFIMNLYQAFKHVMQFKFGKTLFIIFANFAFASFSIFLFNKIDINYSNYITFFIFLFFGMVINIIIVVIINLLINYKQTILSIIKLKQIIHTRNI